MITGFNSILGVTHVLVNKIMSTSSSLQSILNNKPQLAVASLINASVKTSSNDVANALSTSQAHHVISQSLFNSDLQHPRPVNMVTNQRNMTMVSNQRGIANLDNVRNLPTVANSDLLYKSVTSGVISGDVVRMVPQMFLSKSTPQNIYTHQPDPSTVSTFPSSYTTASPLSNIQSLTNAVTSDAHGLVQQRQQLGSYVEIRPAQTPKLATTVFRVRQAAPSTAPLASKSGRLASSITYARNITFVPSTTVSSGVVVSHKSATAMGMSTQLQTTSSSKASTRTTSKPLPASNFYDQSLLTMQGGLTGQVQVQGNLTGHRQLQQLHLTSPMPALGQNSTYIIQGQPLSNAHLLNSQTSQNIDSVFLSPLNNQTNQVISKGAVLPINHTAEIPVTNSLNTLYVSPTGVERSPAGRRSSSSSSSGSRASPGLNELTGKNPPSSTKGKNSNVTSSKGKSAAGPNLQLPPIFVPRGWNRILEKGQITYIRLVINCLIDCQLLLQI